MKFAQQSPTEWTLRSESWEILGTINFRDSMWFWGCNSTCKTGKCRTLSSAKQSLLNHAARVVVTPSESRWQGPVQVEPVPGPEPQQELPLTECPRNFWAIRVGLPSVRYETEESAREAARAKADGNEMCLQIFVMRVATVAVFQSQSIVSVVEVGL